MKRLIVVRHANYKGDMTISESGVRQMKELARRLKQHVEGRVVRMLTSTAPRAIGSADVLAASLNLSGYIEALSLRKDDEHWSDLREVLKLVREQLQDVDVLIVVTHLDHAEELPSFFAEEVLGKQGINPVGLMKGNAVIVDCETSEMEFIRPKI